MFGVKIKVRQRPGTVHRHIAWILAKRLVGYLNHPKEAQKIPAMGSFAAAYLSRDV